jgi:hypothetical protein
MMPQYIYNICIVKGVSHDKIDLYYFSKNAETLGAESRISPKS